MYEIITFNFVTLFLISGFVLLLCTGDVFDKKIEMLFAVGIACVFVLVVVDVVDSYMSHQPTLHNARYFSSALGYTVRPIALGVFISILLRRRKDLLYLWVPIIIESIIAMTNYWTHIMFYFDENNVFYRGPLGLLPHSLCIVYMVLLAYYAIKRFNTTDTGEIITVFYIIAICLFAMYFETFHGIKYLLTGAIVCACTIYYTYLYVQIYKTDSLTGVYNRHTFEKHIKNSERQDKVVICVDLNNLKVINDKEGHTMGDEALCVVAHILLESSEKRCRVYRLGGDEFMIIGQNKSADDAKELIARAKKNLSSTKYSASFGYAMYTPDDDFDEVCAKADEEMYKDKRLMKMLS